MGDRNGEQKSGTDIGLKMGTFGTYRHQHYERERMRFFFLLWHTAWADAWWRAYRQRRQELAAEPGDK